MRTAAHYILDVSIISAAQIKVDYVRYTAGIEQFRAPIEYKIAMSSICEIPGMAAYSVQIPDVAIRFSMHSTGQFNARCSRGMWKLQIPEF